MNVRTVCALKDNYCYLLLSKDGRSAAVVDPSDADSIMKALVQIGAKLELILNTHHHHDHVGGNLELKSHWNCPVFCSARDVERVPGATRGFADGETFNFKGATFTVISIPGHTEGQIAYHVNENLFVGDTVFEMGCGRLFEGTPKQMFESLQKIKALPGDTRIYFGHEYSEINSRFAAECEPSNRIAIETRLSNVRDERMRLGHAAAPTLTTEMKVNPFLRAPDLDAFTALRERRNTFQ